MGYLGLVSVSFRELSPKDIIKITKNAGLDAVEWGGDIHVPAGDTFVADEVGRLTREAGLSVAEYGSYYRAGVSSPEDIDAVVASARALGTNTVRFWAYNKSSLEVTESEYERVVCDITRICRAYPDICFCTECHNSTLTDDYRANLQILRDVDRPNLAAFWQPNQYKSFEYNLESARALSPYIKAAHVFAWEGDDRLPLSAHKDRWIEYLRAFEGREVDLMLEFMHDNSPASLSDAARSLFEMI